MKNFVLLYNEVIEMNGRGITCGICEREFFPDPDKLVRFMGEAFYEDNPEAVDNEVSLYFEGQQSGGYDIELDHRNAPDSVLEKGWDWLRENTVIMTEDEFFDLMEKDIITRFSTGYWKPEGIAKEIALSSPEYDKEQGYRCLGYLVDDHHGIYMSEFLFRSCGADIPRNMHEHRLWCDFTDDVMGKISETLGRDDCAVEFIDGGIALVYYPGDTEEAEDSNE